MRTISSTRTRLACGLAVALLALLWTLAGPSRADAACPQHCVILIEVDGLEPKDATPYMWRLAHPKGDRPDASPALDSARSGWIWQAGRGVMSASTASATVSLLTGGYPQQTGVPADEFRGPEERRLGSLQSAITTDDFLADSVFTQLDLQLPSERSLAFDGDPRLAPLTADASATWIPVSPPPDENGRPLPDTSAPPTPAYCVLPHSIDIATGPFYEAASSCPASDLVTANKAATDTAATPTSFVYMHLAELGRVKRLVGDVDHAKAVDLETQADETLDGTPDGDSTAVRNQLALTDSAIASFVERYSTGTQTADQWGRTVLMIVGNHGYENTPQAMRVPTGDILAPTTTLEDYVEDELGMDGNQRVLHFVPQGSYATVYYTGSPAEKKARLERVVAALGPDGDVNLNPLCEQTGGCIEEVLYTDPADGEPNVRDDHKTWRLDAVDPQGNRPRTEGDLVVVMKRGWSAGRVAPVNANDIAVGENGETISSPYTASAGGPRNRAIAAIVNGPDGVVRQVSAIPSDGRYPVTEGSGGDPFNPPPDPEPAGSLNRVNGDPGDDAGDVGHELQPETVDFAPTIAALMGIGLPERQFAGRFLQEAFTLQLSFPKEDEDIGEGKEPEPEPEPPPVEVTHPPQRDPFPFRGLIRRVSARVVDAKGRPYAKAPRNALLSSIEIKADFGKPRSAVTLTFYKRQAAGSARRPRGRLKAMVRFRPFTVTRGPNVKLKLKIPKEFKPTHIGLSVQEARLRKRTAGQRPSTPNFQGFGPKAGAIVAVAQWQRLHTRKRGAPAKRRGAHRLAGTQGTAAVPLR
jgi:hypothetical protein